MPKAKPVDEVRYYQDEITAEIVVTAKYFCAKDYTVEFTKGPCDLTGNKVGTNSEVTAFKNRNIEWRHDEAAGTYTAKVKFSADARYAFSFVCRNTAGTETQKSSGEFVVDKSAPEITNLEYSPKAPVSALVEALTFGYYKTPVTVKVTVSDVTSGEEGEKYAVSGADRVKLTYVNNGTTFTETLERAAGAAPSANYVFSYELPDIRENYPAATQYDTAFTAVAYDVAENPSDERNEGTTEGAQYNRVIVDTIAPNISVETTAEKVVDEDSLAAVPEEYVYNENDKLLLVAKNQVVLKFTVNEANFYSDDINNGVELTNNEGGAVDLGCKFVLHNLISGDETPLNQTWTKSGDIYTTEVVVSQEKYGDGDYQVELFYKDRSGNDMVFTADRYGNMRADKSYLSQKIVIDSTAPMINVAFDPNDATANEKFFRVTDRTATVRVTERYFAPGDFTFNYTAQKIKEDISVTVDGAGAYNDYGSNNRE